jgi:hypothetical protein
MIRQKGGIVRRNFRNNTVQLFTVFSIIFLHSFNIGCLFRKNVIFPALFLINIPLFKQSKKWKMPFNGGRERT